MNLHKNKELFSQAVEMTSQHFRIKREFVEKDYWIYLYLKIFEESGNDCSQHICENCPNCHIRKYLLQMIFFKLW